MVKADHDYLTKALEKKGIDGAKMSQQEKIDALTKNSRTPPKKTILKKLTKKEGKSNVLTKEQFLQKHQAEVTGSVKEKRKKLDSMWSTYIGDAPTSVNDKYPEFDEKLDEKFAASKGLKYVGSANGKFFYRPIESEKKVEVQSAEKKKHGTIKKKDNQDVLQQLLMHKNMKLPMLRSIASDVLGLPQSGNKDLLVARITDNLTNDHADDDEEKPDADDDADVDEEEDDEEEDDEEEDDEEEDDEEEDDEEEEDEEEDDEEEDDDEEEEEDE